MEKLKKNIKYILAALIIAITVAITIISRVHAETWYTFLGNKEIEIGFRLGDQIILTAPDFAHYAEYGYARNLTTSGGPENANKFFGIEPAVIMGKSLNVNGGGPNAATSAPGPIVSMYHGQGGCTEQGIAHNSCICIYHSVEQNQLGVDTVKNIMDINFDGPNTVTVYSESNLKGQKTTFEANSQESRSLNAFAYAMDLRYNSKYDIDASKEIIRYIYNTGRGWGDDLACKTISQIMQEHPEWGMSNYFMTDYAIRDGLIDPNPNSYGGSINGHEEKAKEALNSYQNIKQTYYKARVVFFANPGSGGQELIVYATEPQKGAQGTVTVQKQDPNGNNLAVAGIKFEVYNAENKLVGTITTDATGRTNTLGGLETGKYTIKEIETNVYGYKENIGKTMTVDVVEGEDKIFSMKNARTLRNLSIEKIDENGNHLANIGFKISIKDGSSTKWLRIYDESNKFINNQVIEEIPIDVNNSSNKVHVEYVSEDKASILMTPESGIIKILNLEKYYAPNKEYTFEPVEVKNPLHFYRGAIIDENGAVSKDKDTKVVVNVPKYKELSIEKVDEESGKRIGNVELILKIEASKNSGLAKDQYIQIWKGDKVRLTEITDDITISGFLGEEKEISGDKYYLAYTYDENATTIIKTSSEKAITIHNLERYYMKDAEITYTVVEKSNPNYGYGNYEGKQTVSATSSAGERATITLRNKSTLRNLIIDKKGIVNDGGEIQLGGVKFALQVVKGNTVQYVKIYKGSTFQKEITTDITIAGKYESGAKLDEKLYYVEYVDSESEATLVVTKEDTGTITINNLEKYYSQNAEYKYKAVEKYNPNFLFKNGKIDENMAVDKNPDRMTIYNEPEETERTMIKEGENGVKLPGVKLILEIKGSGEAQYIRIYNGTTPVNEITEDIHVSGYFSKEAKAGQYYVEYVDKANATKFVTKSDGQITVSGLEKYYDMGKEYVYTASEVENPNYGYGKYTGGKVSGSGSDTKIYIYNTEPSYVDRSGRKVGENNTPLSGVEFLLRVSSTSGKNGYARINNSRGPVTSASVNPDGSNIEITTEDRATIFVTDSSGDVSVSGLEQYATAEEEYVYEFIEIYNNNFWYKGYKNGRTSFGVNDYPMRNTPSKRDLTIEKKGKYGEKLNGVGFVVGIQGDIQGYLQVFVYNGRTLVLNEKLTTDVSISGGTDTYNKVAGRYYLGYTQNEANATIFETHGEGSIRISNIERYYQSGREYQYSAIEKYNNNYSYRGPANAKTTNGNTSSIITVTNEPEVGNIEIFKVDSRKERIPLSGMKFRIQVSDGTTTKYIRIDNKDEIAGSATVNIGSLNIEYVDSKDKATKFVTGADGKVTINNLEIYYNMQGAKYTYTIEEAEVLSHYGYVIDEDIRWEVDGKEVQKGLSTSFDLGKDTTINITAINTQKYTKLSGYVWDDIGNEGKTMQYNNLYHDDENDQNDNLLEGIKVSLYKEGQLIETKWTDKNGAYTFGVNDDGSYNTSNYKIFIEELDKYYIEFEYNGMKYISANLNTEKDNGSKAKETDKARSDFNSQFTEISAGTVKDENGKTTGTANMQKGDSKYTDINYNRLSGNSNDDGYYKSKVDYLEGETAFEAYGAKKYHILSTTSGNYTFTYNPTTIEEIDGGVKNINQGLVAREQIDLAIGTDLQDVDIFVKDYQYNYQYAKRNYENDGNYEVGVKYNKNEDDNQGLSYSRTVYPSDVIEHIMNSTKMEVYVRYKTTIKNQSTNLNATVNKLANYYDQSYTISKVEVIDSQGNSHDITNNVSELQDDVKGYKASLIDLSGYNVPSSGTNYETVYITYLVKDETVRSLLQGDALFNNISEIYSYSTTSADGVVYASLDEDSAPGNILPGEVRTYEDDTDRAPSFTLTRIDPETGKEAVRTIKGKVFRDNSTLADDKTRNGNGKYDDGENSINEVQVDVIEVENVSDIKGVYAAKQKAQEYYLDDNNVPQQKEATYTTGKDGTYEISGLVPGKYVLRYTYKNGTTKVVDAKGNPIEDINVYDYKSTVFKNPDASEDNTNLFWYLANIEERYSDAIDNYDMRLTIDDEGDVVNNNMATAIEKQKLDPSKLMEANTPILDLNIEKTQETSAKADDVRPYTVENVDFGIVDRAKQTLTLAKEITNVKLTLGNGNVIVDGNPKEIQRNQYLQYIPADYNRKGNVKFVLDTELMQSSRVDIQYQFTVINESEIDYATEEYYKYGIIPTNKDASVILLNYTKLVDYIDNDMIFVDENNTNWQRVDDYTKLVDENDSRYLEEKEELDNVRKEHRLIVETVTTDEQLRQPIKPGESKVVASMTLEKVIGIANQENEPEYDNSAEIIEITKTVTENEPKKSEEEPTEPTGLTEHRGASLTYTNTNTVRPDDSNNQSETTTSKTMTIVPGRYEPGTIPSMPTSSVTETVTVTPPTGEDRQTGMIIIAATAGTLSLLACGLAFIIIKKKRA